MSIPRTLHAILDGIRKKEFSGEEATRFYLERIRRFDEKIGAYLFVNAEASGSVSGGGGFANAASASAGASAGGPLLGAPVGLKDLLCTRDMPTTCASRILEGYRPPYDATVVSRLRVAGATFLGKLNMDEFAMGSSNENSAVRPVRNPWDLTRVSGGSSGGSAAAVAAGLAPIALGSDTGGSIRQPASFCGVTGIKPTYGRVSRQGLVAYASSLDQIGPIAHDARDLALVLNLIAGHDPLDSTSAEIPVEDYTSHLTGDVKGLRIGVPREYFARGLDSAVEATVRKALAELEAAGAALVEISLPHTEHAIAVYYLVATAEASSNLARFDGIRYGVRHEDGPLIPSYKKTRGDGFGAEVKRRIMLGTYALSSGYYDAYYKKALEVRTLIQRDFLEAFNSVDVIATPTAPTTAFRLGEKIDDPLTMYLSDIYTISANLAGLPGISAPCGFAAPASGAAPDGGLPVGLQLLGKPFAEGTLLRVADAYQRLTDWHERQPEEFSA
jgi:aspartyl-tRNA(Asn)/glutamyl-tRNA(Gln) amidotransferase subunit A